MVYADIMQHYSRYMHGKLSFHCKWREHRYRSLVLLFAHYIASTRTYTGWVCITVHVHVFYIVCPTALITFVCFCGSEIARTQHLKVLSRCSILHVPQFWWCGTFFMYLCVCDNNDISYEGTAEMFNITCATVFMMWHFLRFVSVWAR